MELMAKPGPKPKGKVNLIWSSQFAYAIGLLTTDGCLSSDGRHIDLTSKDREQIENFMECLSVHDVKIGQKSGSGEGPYWRVQFGDVLFYRFLEKIGLMPRKSKRIEEVKIPRGYFFDFLRGYYDGDGCFYGFWDKRWKSSFMYYLSFVSASKKHLEWLQTEISDRCEAEGVLQENARSYELKYAKVASKKILKEMYAHPDCVSLSRKRLKIEETLGIIGEHLPQ